MSATCWLWFASCQWGIPISLRPPLPFIFLFTIHLTTYRGGRILVISCWIGNLTRSLTSNGDSDPRAFQLTASRGGWRRKRGKGIWNMKFQLTASRGGWRVMATAGCRNHYISTHSLTRRLTPSTARCMNEYKNFNSQPHEEADVESSVFSSVFNISTHSLTRRLTHFPWSHSNTCRYFNSQPHEEADESVRWFEHVIGYFNSQPHEEADNICGWNSKRWYISTHSLTRRLTIQPVSKMAYQLYFNSQPHEEADDITFSDGTSKHLFQLTASRGGWRCIICG